MPTHEEHRALSKENIDLSLQVVILQNKLRTLAQVTGDLFIDLGKKTVKVGQKEKFMALLKDAME